MTESIGYTTFTAARFAVTTAPVRVSRCPGCPSPTPRLGSLPRPARWNRHGKDSRIFPRVTRGSSGKPWRRASAEARQPGLSRFLAAGLLPFADGLIEGDEGPSDDGDDALTVAAGRGGWTPANNGHGNGDSNRHGKGDSNGHGISRGLAVAGKAGGKTADGEAPAAVVRWTAKRSRAHGPRRARPGRIVVRRSSPAAAASRAQAVPAHLAHGLAGVAPQQNALGPDGLGRDHRRGGRYRHGRDRPGLQNRHAEDDYQHGRQQPLGPARRSTSGGVSWGIGSVQTLTPGDADEVGTQCSAVAAAAPLVRTRAQVVYGGLNWNTNNITGTSPGYLAVRDWDVAEGDFFTDRDIRNRNKVCVIGETLRSNLFQNESPVGKDIRIQNVTFRVIGVISRKGANMMGMDQDDVVLAPWTTVKYGLNAGVSNPLPSSRRRARRTPSIPSIIPIPAPTPCIPR